MPKTKRIPTNPRFDLVQIRAYELLCELGFHSLPISPWDIIREYSGIIKCISLSEANQVLKEEGFNRLFHKRKDEGITVKYRGDNVNIIIYDDINIDKQERILWTIMHELGHIFMHHLDDFDLCDIHRGGLSDKEYGVLEVEAHQFAAEMFAPTAVMLRFAGITEDQLRIMCGLSEVAAAKRYNQLFVKTYHPPTKFDEKLIRNFSSFLRWGAAEAIYEGTQRIIGQADYIKYLGCYSFTTDRYAKYCIYCGKAFDDSEWSWSSWYGLDRDELRYHASARRFSYEIVRKKQDWGYDKLSHCPVCQNDDVGGFSDLRPAVMECLQG